MKDIRSLSRFKSVSFHSYSPSKVRTLMRTRSSAFKEDMAIEPPSPQLPQNDSLWQNESVMTSRISRRFQSAVSDEDKIKNIPIEEGQMRNVNKCNKVFENTVFLLILASAILIVLDDPFLDHRSTYCLVLRILDDFLTFLFLLEAFI